MALGTSAHVAVEDALPTILASVPVDATVTMTELVETLKDAGHSRSIVHAGLQTLVERGLLLRSGEGKKGSPYQFTKRRE